MNRLFLILLTIHLPVLLLGQTDIAAKIDSILQSDYQGHQPGLSLRIVKNGKSLYSRGYGLANLEHSIKNTAASVFDIASIAKQFTAACVWTLINEGRLSLDDDVRTFLPEIPDYGDTIRIRHMLNHTSGLRNYSSILDLAGYDYTKHFFNNQSILELMSRQGGLNNKPGEKMLYGNTPFNLLTIIIERISKMTFADYALEQLFRPLGMNNTAYRVDNTSIVKNRAVGYIMHNDSTFSQFPRIESCYGGGSLWSSVEDLTLWSNLFTQPTEKYQALVDFLLAKDMLTTGKEASYSRGLMYDLYRGHPAIHHSGNTKGYRSQIISIPDLQLSVILLANYNKIDPESLSYKMIDLFLSDAEKEAAESGFYSHEKEEQQAFVGTYQELNSCLKMEIILRQDTLLAKSSLGRSFTPLRSLDQNTLCRADSENIKYVFDTQTESELLVYFGATPFYFESVTLVEPSDVLYDDYMGTYYSKELDVSYTIDSEDNKLYLSFPNNKKLSLSPGQVDEFGNGYRTKYTFHRNETGLIDRMTVASEGTVKDIEFRK